MPESTHYPLAEAATAIRVMSAAEHTGKLILDIPHAGRSSVVLPPGQVPVFRPDGAYIITGGLGGLGLFLAEKMAGAGCGRIVLTARSQPNPRARQTIERLRATGADIVVECGNIAEPETAERLVSRGNRHRASGARGAARGGGGRGRHAGQHHRRAHRPGLVAKGLRILEPAPRHERTAAGLVLLVLLGSRAAGLARPGRLRGGQQLGRRLRPLAPRSGPAGHCDRVGCVGRGRARHVPGRRRRNHDRLPTKACTPSRRCCATTAPTPVMFRSSERLGWPTSSERSPWAELFQSTGQSAKGPSKFLAELHTLPQEEWPARLRRMIAEQASVILRRTVDADRPFVEYGLDSLGMLELRTHIETETGIRLSPKVIATHNTARALAQHLADELAEEAEPAAS